MSAIFKLCIFHEVKIDNLPYFFEFSSAIILSATSFWKKKISFFILDFKSSIFIKDVKILVEILYGKFPNIFTGSLKEKLLKQSNISLLIIWILLSNFFLKSKIILYLFLQL